MMMLSLFAMLPVSWATWRYIRNSDRREDILSDPTNHGALGLGTRERSTALKHSHEEVGTNMALLHP